jgi:hypothetical protein
MGGCFTSTIPIFRAYIPSSHLQAFDAPLDTTVQINTSALTPYEAAAVERLLKLRQSEAPALAAVIAKGPQSIQSIYLYPPGQKPKSRTMYDPKNDLAEGQMAVVYMILTEQEMKWMGRVYYSILRVDKVQRMLKVEVEVDKATNRMVEKEVEVDVFMGTYMEPNTRGGHYRVNKPWPQPEEWVTGALVPIKLKRGGKTIEYKTSSPIELDSVQYSVCLTGRNTVPKVHQSSVLEAIVRCQKNEPSELGVRSCDEIDEGIEAE